MKVLVFGEVLYDVYGNEEKIGGGPYNFSIQISRMIDKANSVKMITALGDDNHGKYALEFAKKEGLDTSLMQTIPDFPTGKSTVFLNEQKIPDYIIHEGAAWDNITYSKEIQETLKEEYDVFYLNLLCQRFDTSYNTLYEVMKNIKARYRVLDITLRKSYYTKEKLAKALEFINVLKINEEEFDLVVKLFYSDMIKSEFSDSDYRQILARIQKYFTIEYIFLTLGSNGAYLYNKDNLLYEPCKKDVVVVDTLGAGDSFCAGLSYALASGKLDNKQVLQFASRVASEIIQLKGGVAAYDIAGIKKHFNI